MQTKRLLFWSGFLFCAAMLLWLGIRLMPPVKPKHLGIVEGKLAGCPTSPNCVSTESSDPGHHVEPMPFSGSAAAARSKLIQIVSQMPKTRLITQNENYLHFECRSRLFQFVDDLEFYVDPERQMIQVRSASRLGYSDLGVNRKRVAKIRQTFLGEGTPGDGA